MNDYLIFSKGILFRISFVVCTKVEKDSLLRLVILEIFHSKYCEGSWYSDANITGCKP